MANSLVIYVCKGLPARAGGGLGVAYNYLSAAWGKTLEPASADHILLCGMAEASLPSQVENFDAFLAGLDLGSKRGASLLIWQAARIRELAKRYERIVVLAFTPYYLWPLVQVCGRKLATIHSEHGKGGRHNELAEERGKFGLRERFVQWCVGHNFRFPDRVVFPSRGALNLFTEKNPGLREDAENKAAILYNGVSTCEAPSPRPNHGPLKIVSVAHHVREKGLEMMLDSLRLFSDAGVEWQMINYGQQSTLTPELVAQADRLGIGSRITHAGLQPQAVVRKQLGEADVFLHTPVIVVFDLSLLEAMMHAVPVVTVPLEGNREALGEDYPLYANTPAEVSDRLKWIENHRDEAAEIGKALRERALELFTSDAMVKHYAGLLTELARN
ncbi:glycosyltransferase [Haloferula sp. BvORR071]|uniref:glycosyltransferase family 4 protein n=1 Tax=Haloferula sp. BvORR071 TaxID=1396141 RepID=UPI00054D4286|nr:glycosyltransferase [Haloferula sp. BvORR071]